MVATAFFNPAAFFVDPGSTLQVLSEMSWDTLFLLAGLAFITVAVVGNITGKIAPGKVGRIAAASVGVLLLIAALGYHILLHTFKVETVSVVTPSSYSGPCPAKIPLQGLAEVSGAGNVIYNFTFSTGNGSDLQSLAFTQSGSQIVGGSWNVLSSMPDAWVRLVIASPQHTESQTSGHFSIACSTDSSHAPATVAQDHPHVQPSTAPPTATQSGAAPTAPAGSGDQHAQADMPHPPPPPPPPTPHVMGHLLSPTSDSVEILKFRPANGSTLPRGAPTTLDILLAYNLTSADSAILSLSTAQQNSPDCSGSGELTDAVEVPIVRGTNKTEMKLPWSGDTGLSTKGRVFGAGSVTVVPMFWQNVGGHRGAQRIAVLGTYTELCYRF